MSTVKDQTEKKRLSLTLDRRNTYGENDKASRKSIPLGKQRQHQNARRGVAQALHSLSHDVPVDELVAAELLTKVRTVDSKRKGFKKQADEALGSVLARKKGRNTEVGLAKSISNSGATT